MNHRAAPPVLGATSTAPEAAAPFRRAGHHRRAGNGDRLGGLPDGKQAGVCRPVGRRGADWGRSCSGGRCRREWWWPRCRRDRRGDRHWRRAAPDLTIAGGGDRTSDDASAWADDIGQVTRDAGSQPDALSDPHPADVVDGDPRPAANGHAAAGAGGKCGQPIETPRVSRRRDPGCFDWLAMVPGGSQGIQRVW